MTPTFKNIGFYQYLQGAFGVLVEKGITFEGPRPLGAPWVSWVSPGVPNSYLGFCAGVMSSLSLYVKYREPILLQLRASFVHICPTFVISSSYLGILGLPSWYLRRSSAIFGVPSSYFSYPRRIFVVSSYLGPLSVVSSSYLRRIWS